MATKIHTIKRITKEELKARIIQFRPDGFTDEEIAYLVKTLRLRSLCIVAQAIHFQYMLTCLLEKYMIVRKLYNKLFWKECL